jgi:hypothetical protein
MHARAERRVVVCFFWVHIRACRFHAISEFDDAKRSCRRRLAGHNERRRKSNASEAMARGVAHPHGTCPSVRQSVSQSVVPSVVLGYGPYGYCNCAKGAFGSHAQPTVVASLATHTVSGRRFVDEYKEVGTSASQQILRCSPLRYSGFSPHSENQAWLCVLCPGCENQASQGSAPMRCTFTESLYRQLQDNNRSVVV